MVSAFVAQLKSQPITLAHVVAMILIFLYQFNYDIPYEKIGTHYDRLLVDGQWWRVLTATYSHLSLMHIAFNMFSLWQYGYVEAEVSEEAPTNAANGRQPLLLLLQSELQRPAAGHREEQTHRAALDVAEAQIIVLPALPLCAIDCCCARVCVCS